MRGNFNELTSWPQWVRDLSRELQNSGVYTTGIESDNKQRGTSINVDLYGYKEEENLAIIQVRECVFHPRRFNQVRKNYYLIGRGDTGQVFAHPIESPIRSKKALETPESTVDFALSKIWDCPIDDLPFIIRQGDIAFIPVPSLPKNAIESSNSIILRETHKITGKIWKTPDGKLYCQKARMIHTKGQHSPVKVKDYYYRIQQGTRARLWNFSLAKGD